RTMKARLWPTSFETPATRAPQRLSWVSSALPWSIVPQDGVEDGEKLSGDGDQGHHFRLTDGDQTLVEVFQRRIASTGDEGCHEGGGPNSGRPPSDQAPPAPSTRLAGIGRKSCQACNVAPIKTSQFRQ